MNEDFQVAIGMSTKKDARDAGRELAEVTLGQLSHPPNFFLVFSTIHYEKSGGFEEFLDGIWEILPEGTPLIGGTITGFMNKDGCFVKGVSALAISDKNTEIVIGFGKDTKKKPKKAAEEVGESILKGFSSSNFDNSFIFQLVSGPTTPQFPGVGSSFIVKGKITSPIAARLIETSTKKLQKGIGREEEVLQNMSEMFNDSFIISGSSSDDMKVLQNYQFFNKKVLANSVVALGLKTNRNIDVKYNHGFYKLNNEKLVITDSSFEKKIIKKINKKSAVKEFLRSIHLSDDMLDERLHEKTFYFPLGYENPDKIISPTAIGAILGDGFSLSFKADSTELYVLTATGKSILEGIEKCFNKDASLNFGISCCANLVTLGDNIYTLQERLKDELNNFLVVFTLGEGVYLPTEKSIKFFNETSVIMSIT